MDFESLGTPCYVNGRWTVGSTFRIFGFGVCRMAIHQDFFDHNRRLNSIRRDIGWVEKGQSLVVGNQSNPSSVLQAPG